MNAEKMTLYTADPDGKLLYRVGGLCAILLGLAYLIIVVLYASAGALPSGGEASLKALAGKTTIWWAILGLSVLTDFLFVPIALSLYLALKQVSRNLMLVAAAFIGVFVVLDLAVLWTNHAALLMLSLNYAAATDEIQRAAYVAAANYASAVLASPLIVFYSIVDLSFGILLVGFAMLKGNGIFNKATAYLGLATGITGIAAVASIFVITILNAILATVWVLLVGYRLFRLGQSGSGRERPS